jgi:sodium-dependent dicarboxylate transporter 2/3/5
MGVPVSAALLLSTYFIITYILFPNRLKSVEGAEELIARKLNELGAITKAEKRVMMVFSITSFLWIFQHPLNTYLLKSDVLSDTNIAMTGGLLMFIVPEDFKRLTFLLDWKDTINLQWGILILFGGGLSLAGGLESADVINTVGHWLAKQGTFNIWLVAGLIITTVVLSEFLSNVALVQIFVPVIFGIADGLDINPIFMAMPITLSASIGFMFPIATPPNAIVFSSGYIRMKDMIRAGMLLDVASMTIIFLAAISLVRWVYG